MPNGAGTGAPLPLPPLLTLSGATRLVGRTESWRGLETTWDAVAGRVRRVVLVPGEVGTGKTRLITEFARHVHATGAAVLFGTCSETQTMPYQPFAEAFDHVVAALSAEDAVRRLGPAAAELGRLLPGRHADLAGQQAAGAGDPDVERSRLFQSVVDAVRALAAEQPVLLVLDDLHWARRPTVELLLQLVHDQQLANVMVVASYRSAPADIGDALRAALPDLRHLPGVTRLALGGLDRTGIGEFVTAAGGPQSGPQLDATVTELARQTDGNVFLLVELWQHLVDTGRVTRTDGRWSVAHPLGEVDSPDGVREVVAARLGRLGPTTRRLLELAAVIGTTFDATSLAGLSGLPVEAVLGGLDAATRSRMIGEYGDGQHRFAHELIRRAVSDDLTGADRRTLHLAIARWLAAAPGGGPPAEIAQHLAAAVPLVDAGAAVDAAIRAADAATAASAHDDAVRFLEMALSIAPDRRGDLLLQTADATMRAGDVDRAKQRCSEAFRLADAAGDRPRSIAAALAFSDACWRDSRDAPQAASLLRRVLPMAATDTDRIRVQASLTRALALAGDGDAARVLGEDVLAAARLVDDASAQRLAFDAVSFVPWTPQSLEQQLTATCEAASTARAVGDLEWENHATSKQLYGEILAGDLVAARATAARHHDLATRLGQPLFHVLDRQAHALIAIGEGRFADAEDLAASADEAASGMSGVPSGGYGVQLFAIRREQGRLDEARPVVEAVARLGRAGATWRPALAVMYAELGLHDEARAELDLLTARQLAAVPRDVLWLGSLSYLADACCAVGHVAGAAAVYEQLIGWRGMVVEIGHLLAAPGAVDRYLGQLAVLLGHRREAEIHLAAAVRIDAAARMPVWVARSELELAHLLLAGSAPDAERGRALLDAVLERADRLGLVAVARRAGETRGRDRDVSPGLPAGLTGREVEVLELIAEGRSNRDIGRSLHISQHTAANHVRSILMKTHCANRTEAAAWALRRGVARSVSRAAR